MFNLQRAFITLVLSLSILCPVVTSAGNFDSGYRYDPGDTSQAPWGGQDHSHDQLRRDQERAREQQTDMERERQYRDRESGGNAPEFLGTRPAPHRLDYGGTSTHSYNSTTGLFTDCFGSGNSMTCMNTGGR